MADIHINTVSQCAGGGHRHFDMTINGGAVRRLTLTRDDMALDKNDLEDAIIDRIKSALKETPGITLALATWKAALEGKDFKV